ncbi:MAG: Ada metal-binding domain-containing protein, partial [Terriglobales bacterium]
MQAQNRFATTDARWAAVRARDEQADGAFVYSVRSTGVYCRPSCPARPARPENVAFHDSCEAAEAAGFRACLRCQPKAPPLAERRAEAVARACRLMDTAEQEPDLDSLAREAGMSRFHFHRIFKAHTGITPKAYFAARRAGRVQRELP